ncbi:MAG: tetratricopeptide repeat protein [Promethearchaeota archaeon]
MTKKAYDLVKNTTNSLLISTSLNNIAESYLHLKEYDKAIRYAKDAIRIKNRFILPHVLKALIEIYLSKGDIEKAKVYFEKFHDNRELLEIKRFKFLDIYLNALILKSSLRARDRIKAEDLLKEFALNNTIPSEQRIYGIINLCDIYLTELKITNDPEIIDEIQPYIQELLDIASRQNLYVFLAEAYFLQAKLLLLTSDIKKAKKFLIQAETIAETYDFKRLAMNISKEHDKLLKQEKIWENLKAEPSLSELLEFVGLSEQIEYMLKKRMIETSKISEEKPVSIFIITKGGTSLFSHSFIENKSIESHLFSGFLTTIDYFIREMFSEGLDRAVFREHTLLMKSNPPFFISYIFKGDSYHAFQKLNYFSDQIQKEDAIWQNLIKSFKINQSIHLKDIPSLETLITETFIDKSIVFTEL